MAHATCALARTHVQYKHINTADMSLNFLQFDSLARALTSPFFALRLLFMR